MRTSSLLVLAALALGPAAARAGGPAAPPPPLHLVASIPLPGVEGRIDHLAMDAAGSRLVVAALGSDRVEVIDLELGRVVRTIGGLAEPQGVLVLPSSGRVVVSNGRDGSVRAYDGKTFAEVSRADLGSDADNLRLEAATGRVYAAYGDGGIAVVEEGKRGREIPLGGHPEAFALEAGRPKLYANLPGAGRVAVVDRSKGEVVATWPLAEARGNYPMCLDEARRRLYVGCRAPSVLFALDTETGAPAASIEISGDVDDVWLDEGAQRLYLTCGEGFVDVVGRGDGDRLERVARVPTAKGARTSFWAPAKNVLYVAVPRQGDRAAEVRAYEARR